MSKCKLQHVRKSETNFNICLKNHRKDTKLKKLILTCKHLNELNHNFQHLADFTLIEQIRKKTLTEETRKTSAF